MPTSAKGANAGLNGGQIAGIVIGVLAGVGLMIFGYSYYRKKMANEAGGNNAQFNSFEQLDDEDDAQL